MATRRDHTIQTHRGSMDQKDGESWGFDDMGAMWIAGEDLGLEESGVC